MSGGMRGGMRHIYMTDALNKTLEPPHQSSSGGGGGSGSGSGSGSGRGTDNSKSGSGSGGGKSGRAYDFEPKCFPTWI